MNADPRATGTWSESRKPVRVERRPEGDEDARPAGATSRPWLVGFVSCLLAGSAGAAVLHVTSAGDSGPGTLREAITTAEGNGEIDVILVEATGPIDLLSALPTIDTDLAICGTGQTVSGGGAVRLFHVDGETVLLSGLTLADGRNVGDGGGDGGPGGFKGGAGGGGAGLGGALLVTSGLVRAQGVTFENNDATGGAGGDVTTPDFGLGGGGGGAGAGPAGAGANGGMAGTAGADANGWGGGGAGSDGVAGKEGTSLPGGNGGDFAGGGGSGAAATSGAGGTGGFGGGGGGAGECLFVVCGTSGAGGTHGGAGGGPTPNGNGGGGGAGLGGTIFVNAGSLTVTDSTFTGNSVAGGAGGAGGVVGGNGGSGSGVAHAIYNRGGIVDTGNVSYGDTTNHLFGTIGNGATTPQTGLGITKSDGLASAAQGQAITYAITITNAGPDEVPIAVVTDTFPAALTNVSWSCVATGAVCQTPAGTGNVDALIGLLSPGDEVVFTVDATISATFAGTVSNTATVTTCGSADAAGPNSATDTTLVSPAAVTATKTASGPRTVDSTVTYTVVLTNSGPAAQLDNPGDELTDVLPAQLALVSATADGGVAVATPATNTVTWNGTIAAGGAATITITATLLDVPVGTTVSNQGTTFFDADGDGTNESAAATDDPGPPGAEDPTLFVVVPGSALEVPALSGSGALLLLGLLAGLGVFALRRTG
jgi:uncharacterized repeat protein (TIGR01451 family)